jgi:hypothetical protein
MGEDTSEKHPISHTEQYSEVQEHTILALANESLYQSLECTSIRKRFKTKRFND